MTSVKEIRDFGAKEFLQSSRKHMEEMRSQHTDISQLVESIKKNGDLSNLEDKLLSKIDIEYIFSFANDYYNEDTSRCV